MNTVEFLKELHSKGISVSVDGDELEISAPGTSCPSELYERIAQNRSEIVKAVRLLSEFSQGRERIPALARRVWRAIGIRHVVHAAALVVVASAVSR